jgi:hypothetical protein
MELFLVVLALGLLVAIGLYAKKQQTPTVSIKPATIKEVEPQITDAVTLSLVEDVSVPATTVAEVVEEAPKKRGRKPRITAAKKVVKGKKQVAPKTPRGRKKKS